MVAGRTQGCGWGSRLRTPLGLLGAIIGLAIAPLASAETVNLTTGNGQLVDDTLTLQSLGRTFRVVGGFFDDVEGATATAGGETRLVQTVDGLGVTRPGDTTIGLDGTDGRDILIFEFDELVTLVSLTFSNVDPSDDFDFFLDTNGDGILERVRRDIFINTASGTAPGTSVAQVALANVFQATGTLFGIGADGFDDDFFISAISFTSVSEVPVPAALPLFATAIAAFSLARRKRRKQTRS